MRILTVIHLLPEDDEYELPDDPNQTPPAHNERKDLSCTQDSVNSLDVVPFYDELRRQDEEEERE
jgi:hypothetical protein